MNHREAQLALTSGAEELDLVFNYPNLQAENYATIYTELATLRSLAASPITLKLILETSQLNSSQIIAGCVLAAAANFDFVKTSTGFNGEGATVENVRLMAACCDKLHVAGAGGRKMLVKASGGIRTLSDALGMLEAGAARLGTSAGVWIAKEAKEVKSRGAGVDAGLERPGLSTRLFTDY